MSVAVKELLGESLTFYVSELFKPDYVHPFMNIDVSVVSDSVKPIPPQWVNDVELDEFGAEMGDVIGEGPVLSWSSEERKQRYLSALRRLELNEEMLTSKRMTGMSKSELGQEKKTCQSGAETLRHRLEETV